MNNIYLVISYGGQYEDNWEIPEHAFRVKKDAEEYIKAKEALRVISIDDYHKIAEELYAIDDNLYAEYYNINTNELLEGKDEDEYYRLYDEWMDVKRYEYIKEHYGFSREEFDCAEHDYTYGQNYYMINEIPLD